MNMRSPLPQPDPELDLVLERVIDVPPELVWIAWTTPEHVKKWFTPAPWQTVECEIDLRPGGAFLTVMRSPDGQIFPNVGCYLEIVKNQKLVWTSALGPGYRPRAPAAPSAMDLAFTAVISLAAQGRGTKYTALVIHGEQSARERHAQMGFHEGWGKALEQLIAVAKELSPVR